MIDVTHDGDHGVFEEAFDRLVLELLFNRDDLGVGAELTGDVLDQFAFERLVYGDEDTLHQEGCDEVLAANVELLGEVLDADALGDGDGAGDGHRLTRDLRTTKTRWRLESLHRAFFGLLVALSAAALAWACGWAHSAWGLTWTGQNTRSTTGSTRTRTESRTSSKAWTCATWRKARTARSSAWAAGATWEGACRMHGAPGARCHGAGA